MYPKELEKWVVDVIENQYGKNNIIVSHWWYYIDTYFVVARKGSSIYCLKISPERFEESNVLYIS